MMLNALHARIPYLKINPLRCAGDLQRSASYSSYRNLGHNVQSVRRMRQNKQNPYCMVMTHKTAEGKKLCEMDNVFDLDVCTEPKRRQTGRTQCLWCQNYTIQLYVTRTCAFCADGHHSMECTKPKGPGLWGIRPLPHMSKASIQQCGSKLTKKFGTTNVWPNVSYATRSHGEETKDAALDARIQKIVEMMLAALL